MTFRTFVLVGLVLAAAPARALVPGGGPARTDCHAEWQVTTPGQGPTRGRSTVDCTDGDAACDADGQADGHCSFAVSVCVAQGDVAGCVPEPVTAATVGGRVGVSLPPLPAPAAACGDATSVVVPLRTNRRGRTLASRPVKLRLAARTASGRDADTLSLRCLPSAAPAVACPANPSGAGAPNELRLTVADAGTDLDNGWKGPSQNFPTPAGTQMQLCLEGCDATTNPLCTTRILTGPGTFNQETFGPPLPLFTAGIPVCVMNRFAATQATGTANLSTGEVNGPLSLLADVFMTDETHVCPRCETGTCDSGPNQGRACSVDGIVTVAEAAASNKRFKLSKDCPPPTDLLAGTLKINLPLTTGTSTLAPLPGATAATPCVAQPGEPKGLRPLADSCGAGTCVVGGCAGTACADPNGRDYVTGEPVCIDAKGGVSQACCSTYPTVPCIPTDADSEGLLARQGRALAPQPAWPDPTYPKRTDCAPGECLVQVAAFCEPASGTGSVDGLAGLPGPAAIVLPVTTEWLQTSPAGS